MSQKKTQTKKETPKKEDNSLKNIELSMHEVNIQIDDLKLAITSLTKGLKGVYEELDTHTNRINKVADRLGL